MDKLNECLNSCYTNFNEVSLEATLDNGFAVYDNNYTYLDELKFSIDLSNEIIVHSNNSGIDMLFNDKDYCLDSILVNLGLVDLSSTQSFKSYDASMDEESDSDSTSDVFLRARLDNIVSDLSTVVVSKLMYDNNLIGYRFRLNNGCLDISIDKGNELGIVPYKVGKRVNLKAINGVLASNYECTNKVLFPDISNNDDLCRRLLEVVLST